MKREKKLAIAEREKNNWTKKKQETGKEKL